MNLALVCHIGAKRHGTAHERRPVSCRASHNMGEPDANACDKARRHERQETAA
jgi:hypothetical protein